MTRLLSTLFKMASIGLIAFLHSCYYDIEEDLYPIESVGDVTYSNDIEPIIKSSCAVQNCHVTGGIGIGVLDSYEAIKAKVDQGVFRQRVVVDRSMPPNGLAPIDLQKIEIWLNEGAPNN